MKITKKKLEALKGENDLKDYVIDYVIDELGSYEDIKGFFEDLQRGGCASGMICGLIYYVDTAKFYDKFYNEIEEMREDWEFQTGETLQPKGDLKNWFAWFAFEETARNLANELGLDL